MKYLLLILLAACATEAPKVVETPQETITLGPTPSAPGQDYFAKSTLKVVKELADIGNCLVAKKEFYEKIRKHKQFDYTKHTSEQVAINLAKPTPVVLSTYRKTNTPTVAYRKRGVKRYLLEHS